MGSAVFIPTHPFAQDEEAALLAELERIKKERAEEARKKVRGHLHGA